jgi:hypothetical protein
MADGAGQAGGADLSGADRAMAFLAAMEARDLAAAGAMLAPGFEMRFPGTGPMRELGELVAWASGRYRRIGKVVEGVETVPGPDGEVVWIRGTLHGAWPDGTAFEGIRFVDRFEIAGGRIARQDVWNDLSEMRPRAGDAETRP